MDLLLKMQPYIVMVSYSIIIGAAPGVLAGVFSKLMAMRHCIDRGYFAREIYKSQNGPLRETGRLIRTKEYMLLNDDQLVFYVWIYDVVAPALALTGFVIAFVWLFCL